MTDRKAIYIHVKGLVQGVGFRPFVYRLATIHKVTGWVENGNDGVRIHAEAYTKDMGKFLKALKEEAPAASQIVDVITSQALCNHYDTFAIRKSADYSDEITEISPDIAVCEDCLNDMRTQSHRINYPLINCTNCGPRFSIIKNLPYDRAMTTMEPFIMCSQCEKEYTDIFDRRFHAQPVACNHCGPAYSLHYENRVFSKIDDILKEVAGLIAQGKIVAIKGTGGFHLACDATRQDTVEKLRRKKNREGKPFAVMFRDIEAVKDFLHVSPAEEQALCSWRRPIVILQNLAGPHKLATAVSNGFSTTGAMLPYMPMHYLLFEKLNTAAIVMTSGNLSDEPVMIDNSQAESHLGKIADAFLFYNRDIHNRTDDSVMMFTGHIGRVIRRSRGFAPGPVNLGFETEGIFAAGAELVNCFCLGKGTKAFLSQHIGDLKNLETLEFYSESIGRQSEMFRVKPALIACDLHPDYLSSRFAREYAADNGNMPLAMIQHHHAHIAACMAENGIDEKVIGISLDGVGFGTDGNIWGFEAMICDFLEFERKIHLDYVQQPGGDKANEEPWRMAVAFLKKYIRDEEEYLDLPFLQNIDKNDIEMVSLAIDKHINTPLTSSAGRLFDAVSAMTGLGNYALFHAEPPMRLENVMDPDEAASYAFQMDSIINPETIIIGIINDIRNGVPVSKISARFHRTIVEIILEIGLRLRNETGLNKIILSGGTFQNRFLLSQSIILMKDNKFDVYSHSEIPSNDGGIALGQLAIAAKRRLSGFI